jgi:thioredoxin-dependent peroxiredoxin
MVSVGDKIDTAFPLKVVQDGAIRETLFRDLLVQPVIVSVYMKNNTPSCDRQNDSLASHAGAFAKLGYGLVAISRDTCGSHLKYAAKKGIGYILASDPGDLFAKATDSVVEKSMYGRTFYGPARAAYVIGIDGTVLAAVDKVDTKDHAGQIERTLASL